jgi:hypothetical protein
MPYFDDAWALLKQVPQIDLSNAEREFVPMARAGGANDARNLQSNLGLFDPALAVQTVGSNFEPQQIRIGRGQPAPRAPQIESQFMTPYHPGDSITEGGFKIMGVPAGGGTPVQMSKVSGLTRRKHPIDGGFSHFQLGGLGGATPPEFRRQGNYEKLMRAILSQGIGIQSTNRNAMSNPFHRKFSGKTGDMYNVTVDGERRDDVEDKNIRGSTIVDYNPPMIHGKDGGIITQRPIGAPPGERFPHGEPEGGFGSLARYDFGALPFRRNLDFEENKNVRGDDRNTEQTLLAEAVLANMNRSRNTPMSMHDMLFEGGRMGQRERARYSNSPMRGEMRGRVDDLPSPTSGGGLRYALGFNTPHRPLTSDEKTGDPLLLVQPQGSIAQRINDEIRERERQAEIARREEEERQEWERRQQVESLLPNAGDLSDPANRPMLYAIQELIRRQQMEQENDNDDSWVEELGSLFG